ncbi:hypothetical protein [Mycobacterium lepromatosis]|nr:hypothetical protein [Mycobacterium lepromatosis]
MHTEVIAEQLCPGDVIEVQNHEVISTDVRAIQEIELDESSLTDES